MSRQSAVLALSAMNVEDPQAVADLMRAQAMWLHMLATADLLTGAMEGTEVKEVLAVELGGASTVDLEAVARLATMPLTCSIERELLRA